MSSFIGYYRVDCSEGIRKLWRCCLLSVIMFLLLNYALDLRVQSQQFELTPTFAERISSMVTGGVSHAYQANAPFSPPIDWFALVLLAMYLSIWYPFRSLYGFGKQLIVAGSSRWQWWLAKCCWVVTVICIFFALGIVTTLIVTLVDGGAFSLVVTKDFFELYRLEGVLSNNPGSSLPLFLVSIPIVMSACALTQLVISLFVHPIAGYIYSIVLMFLSAYFASPWLLGNYAMLIRSNCAIEHGFDPIFGISLSILFALAAVIGGGVLFSKKDIISEGNFV